MIDRLKALLWKQAVDPPPSQPADGPWPFDQPRNCAVLTMRQVLDGSEPILLVSHDTEDHGWQFLGRSDASLEAGRLVTLESMVKRDPGVLRVADLPPGWQAFRSSPEYPWQRRQSPPE